MKIKVRKGEIIMRVLVRQAAVSDFVSIHRLNRECLGYEYDEEATKANLTRILALDYYKVYIALWEEEVAGYVQASSYDNTYSVPLKNIMGIAVLPALQGQGIGRLLLEKVEQWAKEDGCLGVRLVSGVNRKKAHFFYGHCGYTRRKEQINFVKWF